MRCALRPSGFLLPIFPARDIDCWIFKAAISVPMLEWPGVERAPTVLALSFLILLDANLSFIPCAQSVAPDVDEAPIIFAVYRHYLAQWSRNSSSVPAK